MAYDDVADGAAVDDVDAMTAGVAIAAMAVMPMAVASTLIVQRSCAKNHSNASFHFLSLEIVSTYFPLSSCAAFFVYVLVVQYFRAANSAQAKQAKVNQTICPCY